MGVLLAFIGLAVAGVVAAMALTGGSAHSVLSGQAHQEFAAEGPQVGAGSPSSSSPSTSTATTPSGPGETAFITALLHTLGAPASQQNISSLAAWFKHEEPGWPVPYANNPLNVKGSNPAPYSYSSVTAGVAATAKTIEGYPAILAALKSGQGLCGNSSISSELLTWSGGGYSSVC